MKLEERKPSQSLDSRLVFFPGADGVSGEPEPGLTCTN